MFPVDCTNSFHMYDGIGKYVYIFFLQSSNGREKCDKMFGNTNKREHGGTMRADFFFLVTQA
jgi:hypothetical protein